MTFSVSVIICSFNPRRDYLRRVLDALKAQTLPQAQWELILADNASKEPLASIWDLSWHPHARHLREEKTGKTQALLTAIQEARGDVLMTVDDDNVLAPDYLETAVQLGRKHPHLGVWGGSCIAEFEVQPPEFLNKYIGRLAISTVSRPRWSNSYGDFDAIPAGAGMLFRRVAAQRYREVIRTCPLRKQLGPTGTMLTRCDDTDIAWTAIDLGFSAGRFPELKLTHLIPKRRVEPDYMLELIEGDALSRVLLDEARKLKTFSTRVETSLMRSLWLRLRLSDFDYKAWRATESGIRKGISLLNPVTI
jgi:glycosyltransferase involved in cell wall biosynthesis